VVQAEKKRKLNERYGGLLAVLGALGQIPIGTLHRTNVEQLGAVLERYVGENRPGSLARKEHAIRERAAGIQKEAAAVEAARARARGEALAQMAMVDSSLDPGEVENTRRKRAMKREFQRRDRFAGSARPMGSFLADTADLGSFVQQQRDHFHATSVSPIPYTSPRERDRYHTPWTNPPGWNEFALISTKLGFEGGGSNAVPIRELKRQWACQTDGRELMPGTPSSAAEKQNWWTGTYQDPRRHPDPRYYDRRQPLEQPPASALSWELPSPAVVAASRTTREGDEAILPDIHHRRGMSPAWSPVLFR